MSGYKPAFSEDLVASEYAFFSDLMASTTGVVLGPDKRQMVQTRLAMLAMSEGISSTRDLYRRLKAASDADLREKVIECLLNNETSFFRHRDTFDALTQKVIPDLVNSPSFSGVLRIWSASCSTGQEPYSIAMALRDCPELRQDIVVQILATDISKAAIEQARSGRYSQLEVGRGLPIDALIKQFEQEGTSWVLRPDIKRMVNFQRVNLLDPLPRLGRFHIIFCRNVLIYFCDADKRRVLGQLRASLLPDGFLFLGPSESGVRFSFELAYDKWNRAVFYRPKEQEG